MQILKLDIRSGVRNLFTLSFKKIIPYLLISFLLMSSTALAGWQLEWIDSFDGSRVDKSNWTSQTQANYNAEVQCYTDDDTSVNKNYDVSNGSLKIIARKGLHSCTGLGGQTRSWTSGRINSKDKREFLFGRIEARIRFNELRAGTWPAFWMIENRINEQPFRGDNDFVGWPNPGAGEIDVWEWYSRGSNSYITNFFNTSNCGREVRYNYPGGASDVLQWHDYAMEWDQNSIKFFIDDTLVASNDISNCAQYKEPMFILLNVAMGGTLGGAIDSSLSTATMEVDYVAHCSASDLNNVTSCNQNTPVIDTLIQSIIDIDGNGRQEALTDGLLILRYLFGFRGENLIENSIGNDAKRTSSSDIETYLLNNIDYLDIDGNGEIETLSDGLLIMRYLFGYRDDALIDSSIAAGATRITSLDVELFIQSLNTSTANPEKVFNDGLLSNGDFENGVEDWTGNAANVPNEPYGINATKANFSDISIAGNPWDVNLSQEVAITQGKTYTLNFKAKSNRDRSILAGIGLNMIPWTNSSLSVSLTTDWQEFSLILSANNFGGINSRVLFDIGADIGQVIIDEVSLFENDI